VKGRPCACVSDLSRALSSVMSETIIGLRGQLGDEDSHLQNNYVFGIWVCFPFFYLFLSTDYTV